MDLRELLNLDKKLIFLENINGDKLGILNSYIQDVRFSPRFNSISTLSFRVYQDECPYYSQITSWRRIQVQDLMRFIIEKPLESNDGLRKYKEITCRSLEIDINRKTVPLLQGTYKFYSIIPSDETICSIILSYLPNWTIESVDSSLWNVYRTFDLQDRPLYQMMMEDIENAYECIFDFDTLNQTITIKAFENIPNNSDIYLSFDNLVNELNITEDTESLITSITVHGGNDLAINIVNPLGNTIYNFQHFATTEYMSADLVTAINNWKTLIATNQIAYSDNLLQRKTKISERITLETELVELQSQLKSLTEVRDALLDSGLNATAKNAEVRAKQTEINNKETAIESKQTEIDNIDLALQNIQNTISLKSYFTQEQLLELEPFIINISITDENFTKVDTDTDLDIQETAQDLYDKYKRYLDMASKMKYKFSIDLINFISLEEYKIFTQQLQWGITVNLETESNGITHPMLLGLDVNLDNETDVQFLFGEDLRYEDSAMSYEDYLANQLSNVSNMVTGSSVSWGEYVRTAKTKVDNLFNFGLRTDLTQIINSEKQEMIIDDRGLLGRKYISQGIYEDEQIKVTNNKLVFTDDGFNSLKTVIGKVTLPDGSTAYGFNVEVMMGVMTLTDSLIVKNANNTFQVDANGAILKNASLTIEKGLNKILLDPTNGFKIQNYVNSAWNDVVYLGTDGNLKVKGDIYGGSININDEFIVDEQGNMIATSGEFTGTITASNFNQGTIEGSTINIGEGNFTVDEDGNVTSNGNFNLLGNIRMGGNITWDNPVVLYQYSTNNSSWHNNFIEGDKYRRESWDGGLTWQTGYQFVGTDGVNGVDGSDANVPGYIKSTYIDFTQVSSPYIRTNLLEIQTPDNYNSNSGFLLKGYYNSSNYDLFKIGYYKGDAPYVVFSTPSGAYAQWNVGSTWFNNNVYFGGNVSFLNATVTGLNVTARFG